MYIEPKYVLYLSFKIFKHYEHHKVLFFFFFSLEIIINILFNYRKHLPFFEVW